MIVILCNSFEDAKNGFDMFIDFLETYEPLHISRIFESSYCVETDDDLKYVFVDHRLKSLFLDCDCVELGEFFEGIDDYYFKISDFRYFRYGEVIYE